jgi:glycosyltransferase involved in cell wall biosynthesis
VDKKNLLLISHTYNDFVKDQVETVAPDFAAISVCVRYNIALKYLSRLPLPQFSSYKVKRHLDLTGLPGNVAVYPTEILYGPSESQNRKLGDLHARKLISDIRKNALRFDLVHSHFTYSAGYAGARVKEKYATPLIVTAHGYDIYYLPFKDADWKEKIEYVLGTADHVITVSRSNLDCIKKLDVSTPVTVIPNGFKKNLFFPRDQAECRRILNLPHDKKIVLAVGVLEHVKGHRYLIDAMHAIRADRNDTLCVIIGGGSQRSSLEHQIRDLGLQGSVILAGDKPHDSIPVWMNACDIVVLPSLSEGNPLVMFEALGCGKPFVGTKVGGVPEVIISDTFGLTCEPSNPGDLAEKIAVALDRNWDLAEIVRYADNFTWDTISKEIISIYHSVL